jgi:MoaA/NifB/PqqE/SkfB family radical SAM enzyme
LQEIYYSFSSLGEIDDLLLSGGEPFMREDLEIVLGLLVLHNKVKSITIPTNGYFLERIDPFLKSMHKKYPKTNINISISLNDDEYFEESLALIKKLSDSKININTVITPGIDIDKIINAVSLLGIDEYSHSFEIERPKEISNGYRSFNKQKLSYCYLSILQYKMEMFKGSLFSEALYFSNLYWLYKTQYDVIVHNKDWPVKCKAGTYNKVIYSDGSTANCELIRNGNAVSPDCKCTHLCYILPSLYSSWTMVFILMPIVAIVYLLNFGKVWRFE